MKILIITIAISSIISYLISAKATPFFILLSSKLGWTDKPNERKLHSNPVPVIGGIIIFISVISGLILSGLGAELIAKVSSLCIALVVIFITGMLDDKYNLSSKIRLVIQFLCAYIVVDNGIRIKSLYGLFNIGDLPNYLEYGLTIFIIMAVVNAFNLIDGINGLSGGYALINCILFAFLAFFVERYYIFGLLVTIIPALIVFLKNNLIKTKLFMGDAGSTAFGFLFATVGIILINSTSECCHPVSFAMVLLIVITLLLVPMVDSLRVYLFRFLNKKSIFSADKTHIHHITINNFSSHLKSTMLLYGLHLAIILNSILLYNTFSVFIITILNSALILAYCATMIKYNALSQIATKMRRAI